MAHLPEIKFDESRAIPCYPRPLIKCAVLVPGYLNFPHSIRPEWDSTKQNPQNFFGDFYLIMDEHGGGRYGSAYDQWVNMHRQIDPDFDATWWVKVLYPVGYHIAEDCTMVTLVVSKQMTITESRKVVKAGTLVLRQPGGEYQFVRPEDEAKTYFSESEARALGLFELNSEEFAEWAVAQARTALLEKIQRKLEAAGNP